MTALTPRPRHCSRARHAVFIHFPLVAVEMRNYAVEEIKDRNVGKRQPSRLHYIPVVVRWLLLEGNKMLK